MQVIEITILATALLSILFFLLYVVSLLRMPGERPKTPAVDRFGDPIPPTENPGFRETEEEHH